MERIITRLSYSAWRGTDHHTVVGNVLVYPNMFSPQLGNERNVLVYLPPSYATSRRRRYPVIYMHDGQNLFDGATSFSGVEWQVDETMRMLSAETLSVSREGIEAIVVGIENTRQRLAEYNPFSNWWKGQGDAYLAFITETLKPMIDSDFRTSPDRDRTGIVGSSMGGLISLYAFFRRPDVFGLIAAMSPAFWVSGSAMHDYVRKAPFVEGRIYLDHGTREYSARPMRDALVEKGYRLNHDLMYVAEKGGEHNEAAWARRLPNALRFLLAPSRLAQSK